MKARNIIFSIVVCMCMAGPLCLLAFDHSGISLDLPSWLTSEGATYLEGNQEKVKLRELFKPKYFKTKELQDGIETYLGNSIPMKANALLFNAALQRNAIEASNSMFGFPAYRTTYGGTYYYLVEEQALCAPGWAKKNIDKKQLKKFCRRLNKFSEEHKDIKVILMLGNDSRMQSSNPVVQMSHRAIDPIEMTEWFKERLVGENSDCTFIDSGDFPSMSEYYRYFFKSDHHWNARGAIESANKILKAMGKEQTDYDVTDVDGPPYSGSYMRYSLDPISDQPIDIDYDFSDLLMLNEEKSFNGNEHLQYYEASYLGKHYQFYDLFYEKFEETKGPGSGRVLMVSDSLGYSLIRPIAQQSESVFSVSDLHSQMKNSESLSALLEKTGADTVVFVGHIGNYATFCERQPKYFS